MCKCISTQMNRVEKLLENKYPDQTHFNVESDAYGMIFPANKLQTLTRISYLRGKRKIKTFLTHKFCPFCGQPYDNTSTMKVIANKKK